ncbi:heme-binding domain-containing protein [Salinimicrobium sp. CAU 1759]
MRILKIIGWVLLFAFIVVQFIPVERNQSDIIPKTDFMLVNNVPENLKNKLHVSCYDCHSNNTRYPWYDKIQPVAWFLEDHIKEGKAELNFSQWGEYSDRRKNSKLRSIISQIEEGKMPLDSYVLLHPDADLSEEDKLEFINYMQQLKEDL